MNFRNDTYTGGEHYWIRFHNGIHEVVRETFEKIQDEVVFVGHYEKCIDYLEQLKIENVDYDLNL